MHKWGKIISVFAVIALGTSIAGTVPADRSLLPIANTASAKDSTANHILLNNKHIDVGNTLLIKGTNYVPLKHLAAAMGYTLSWDAGAKRAELLRPGRKVILKSGSAGITVNGTAGLMAQPAKVSAGTLYIPLAAGAKALGGTVHKDSGEFYITDSPRYVTASLDGSTYWVAQSDGTLYARFSGQSEPKSIGSLDMGGTPYQHTFSARSAWPNTVLLELLDKHYAMFNDFENRYQVLLQEDKVVKQTAYHYNTSSYEAPEPGPASTQLYMSDGSVIEYIQPDGNLGTAWNLPELTGQSPDSGYRFRVEYAAPDILIARSQQTARLYAIAPSAGQAVDLSEKLIDESDWQDWERADGSDPYVLRRMLTLKQREGNVFTFVYTPLLGGDAKKKTIALEALTVAGTSSSVTSN